MKNQKSVQLFEASEIQSRIVAVRNVQVMLDRQFSYSKHRKFRAVLSRCATSK